MKHVLSNLIQLLSPVRALRRKKLLLARTEADQRLDALSRSKSLGSASQSRVLVDATWDNPNYWIRYSLLRAALGLSQGQEAGLLGPFSRNTQRRTLDALGIHLHFDLLDSGKRTTSDALVQGIVTQLKEAGDILQLSLPDELPGFLLYDYILKRQRQAFVQIGSQDFVGHIRFFLNCQAAADRILSAYEPDLIVASHAVGYQAALVWTALRRGIRVIIPFGDNGLLRMIHLNSVTQITEFADRPRPDDRFRLSPEQVRGLQNVGQAHLQKRLSGQSTNLGAMYAYNKPTNKVGREDICRLLGWPSERPLVAVYASNWFDFPHSFGMKHFRDFHDWIEVTLAEAIRRPDVSWLFKAHPCDAWYGGISLGDIVEGGIPDHIKIADSSWNGKEMLDAIDAFVTFHGTVGLEATALGKPVLVADKGWYDDWNFVQAPADREDYRRLLGQEWWAKLDRKRNAGLAELFAGWYWGRPCWQNCLLLEDDSLQNEIYSTLPEFLSQETALAQEIAMIRRWYDATAPHYHAFKMLQANHYLA